MANLTNKNTNEPALQFVLQRKHQMYFAENKSTRRDTVLKCIYVSKGNNIFTDVIEMFAGINVSDVK